MERNKKEEEKKEVDENQEDEKGEGTKRQERREQAINGKGRERSELFTNGANAIFT